MRKPKSSSATLLIGLALAFAVVVPCAANAGIKVAGDEKTYLNLGGLLQAHAAFTKDGSPDGDSVGTEFYLRRMRLMAYGQLNDKINFFIETDNPNFGKDGDFSMNTFIQDAYVELNLHEFLQIDMGMLLVPFSHHGMQGATTLLGLDYHGTLLKYPSGSNKVWRDYGIMFRGMISKWFEYRLGIFNGVHGNKSEAEGTDADGAVYTFDTDPRNPKDLPRFTMRLTFNIFEPEGGAGAGGFFYDGLYIKETDKGTVSPKKILAIGGSADWQRSLNIQYEEIPHDGTAETPAAMDVDTKSDYFAVAGDVFWDIPIGAEKIMAVTGQVNFFYYNHGDRTKGLSYYDVSGNTSNYTGIGLMAEAGYRYDFIEPVISFDWFNSEGTAGNEDVGDYLAISGGVNYWMYSNSFNLKLQVGGDKANGADDWGVKGMLQAQLLF